MRASKSSLGECYIIGHRLPLIFFYYGIIVCISRRLTYFLTATLCNVWPYIEVNVAACVLAAWAVIV